MEAREELADAKLCDFINLCEVQEERASALKEKVDLNAQLEVRNKALINVKAELETQREYARKATTSWQQYGHKNVSLLAEIKELDDSETRLVNQIFDFTYQLEVDRHTVFKLQKQTAGLECELSQNKKRLEEIGVILVETKRDAEAVEEETVGKERDLQAQIIALKLEREYKNSSRRLGSREEEEEFRQKVGRKH